MPRDASGNYTLPPGNPVVPRTIIETDWANPTMEDIAFALTDSLSRTGLGGMAGPFKNADGTISAPGISWTNEPSSGWYRKGANEFWYSVGGQDVFAITDQGIALASGKTAEGISSFINVQDDEPADMKQGETWYDSDNAAYLMEYVNPDATRTLISLGPTGGDFVPYDEKGAPDGVATLDSGGQVPASQLLNAFPIGAVYITAGNTSPAGFLGGTWSQIAAGRVLLGVGTLGSDTYAAGEEGGEARHALTEAENGSHSHPFTTNPDGAHVHTLGGTTYSSDGGSDPKAVQAYGTGTTFVSSPMSISAESAGTHSHTGTSNSSGSSTPHENRQPYLAVYYWQRTA